MYKGILPFAFLTGFKMNLLMLRITKVPTNLSEEGWRVGKTGLYSIQEKKCAR